MRRLFCAVGVPQTIQIQNATTFLQEKLVGAKVNWVAPGNLHLTLKFFGETNQAQTEMIIEALRPLTLTIKPFTFTVEGCGFFGKPNRPNIVWLGVRNTEPLVNLYKATNQNLVPLGYKPDKPHFVPHLTIGRIKLLKGPIDSFSIMETIGNELLANVKVDSFVLVESLLRPQGPVYKIVEPFGLG